MREQRKPILISIFAIVLFMNILYFTNIMPPIPLALREAGLYHSIKRTNGSYVMTNEKENFLKAIIYGQTLHLTAKEYAYAYTAVFAPTNLKTTIVHHWQHYDEKQEKWISVSKLPFYIIGGRKAGYKGYSWISELNPGRWRVYVENERGQVLGRIRFNIQRVEHPMELQEVIR